MLGVVELETAHPGETGEPRFERRHGPRPAGVVATDDSLGVVAPLLAERHDPPDVGGAHGTKILDTAARVAEPRVAPGPSAVARYEQRRAERAWPLAREQLCATPVTALDLNPFLLREAKALSEREGLGDAIKFEQGNAEELPFSDNTFDIVLSVTVIEECDADKAISEMVRVVRPGGRVMIKVRACDMHLFWNILVDPEIKAKAETPIRQVANKGIDIPAYILVQGAATLPDAS